MKNARSFNIPESTLSEVIQYLSTCPYAQVNKLITELGDSIQRSLLLLEEANVKPQPERPGTPKPVK